MVGSCGSGCATATTVIHDKTIEKTVFFIITIICGQRYEIETN
jgi:hypothetical protein